MSELKFKLEWESGDGVSHPALARTWARCEILIDDQPATTVYDKRVGGTRTGIYAPAFLIAEWLVRNFWFLLWECAPTPRAGRAWLRRHSMLAAREGMSFPRICWARDEAKVVAVWTKSDSVELPVDFVTSGVAELEPAQVQNVFTQVIDMVLDRLRDCDHPDVAAVRKDWEIIASTAGRDLTLAQRAARLGLDSMDEEDVPEALIPVILESADRLPKTALNDFLDAGVIPAHLPATLAAVADAVGADDRSRELRAGTTQFQLPQAEPALAAYKWGYEGARMVRRQLNIAATKRVALEDLVAQLGWQSFERPPVSNSEADRAVKGVVGFSGSGRPQIAPLAMHPRSKRFLLARGIYALLSGAASSGPRVMTSAGSRTQAASRAFAAELLAPAQALREYANEQLDDDREAELAEMFDVHPQVVRYQLENLRSGGHQFA